MGCDDLHQELCIYCYKGSLDLETHLETITHTKNVRGEISLSNINICSVQPGSKGCKVYAAEGTLAIHCVQRNGS